MCSTAVQPAPAAAPAADDTDDVAVEAVAFAETVPFVGIADGGLGGGSGPIGWDSYAPLLARALASEVHERMACRIRPHFSTT